MTESSNEKNEEQKLDWMYRDSTQVVDREEYLLGRKIDRQFENSALPPDKDQECLPTSNFAGLAVVSQVDIARKLQEDPLYLIKRKEIESREQLLKNPRKVKQLQEMLARQQAAAEKLKRKQMKKNKKKKTKDIDSLLATKCKKLFGGLDAKKLASLEISSESSSDDSKVELRRGKTKQQATKDLDRLLAVKYKKVLGNIDAKELAEMSSDSEESSQDEKKHKKLRSSSTSSDSEEYSTEIKEKRRKKRSSSSSSDGEKFSTEIKKKMRKKEERRRRQNSSDDEYTQKYETKRRKELDKKRDLYSEEDQNSKRKVKPTREKYKHRDFSNERELSKSKTSRRNHNDSSETDSRSNDHKKYRNKERNSSKKEDSHWRSGSGKSRRTQIDLVKSKQKKKRKGSTSEETDLSDHKNTKQNIKHLTTNNTSKEMKHKKSKHSSTSSDSSTDSEKSLKKKNHIKKTKEKVKRRNHSSSSESCSNNEQKNKSKKVSQRDSANPYEEEDRKEEKQPKKQYGLVLPTNYVPKEKPKEDVKLKIENENDKKPQVKEANRKLTAEEKELKLKEMMSNVKWRDELREKNVKAHQEKQKAEKDDYVYNENFMRNQMAYAMSQGSVESRVKANINTIQRRGGAMDEHFARRK